MSVEVQRYFLDRPSPRSSLVGHHSDKLCRGEKELNQFTVTVTVIIVVLHMMNITISGT